MTELHVVRHNNVVQVVVWASDNTRELSLPCFQSGRGGSSPPASPISPPLCREREGWRGGSCVITNNYDIIISFLYVGLIEYTRSFATLRSYTIPLDMIEETVRNLSHIAEIFTGQKFCQAHLPLYCRNIIQWNKFSPML